jgi:hypothetical protein
MVEENRRYYSRVKFEADAQLRVDDALYPAELVDLSLRGALLRLSHPVDRGTRVRIQIRLPASQLFLKFDAELAHKAEEMHGFRFTTMDVDTLCHLRQLLELNLGDTVRGEQELEHWLAG